MTTVLSFRRSLIFVLFVALAGHLMAQGRITGKVVDAQSHEAVEYATVALLRIGDSSLVSGGVTVANGRFSVDVPYGTYILRVSFMGYETYFHPSRVVLSEKKSSLAVGTLSIRPAATLMEDVVITAERSMVEYQLDKRVVNVDKNIVSSGGTATDVLEQVPSVAVDNDGNVTLRGSTNVKVLINGRPSELLSSDLSALLEQIPATTVEAVEVITNPSAKYDPEGMSGIINIKLKDRSAGSLGLNGVVNLNAGAPLPSRIPNEMDRFIPTTMGNISLNYTTEKYNLFLNTDAGLRQRGHYGNSDLEFLKADSSARLHHDIDEYSVNPSYMGSIKVGGEYFFNEYNSLLLSYQLRGGNRKRNSDIYATDLLFADSLHYQQIARTSNRNTNHSFNLLYTKKFPHNKDEELTLDATFSTRATNGEGTQELTYQTTANWDNYYLRESKTSNSHQALNVKLNWLLPFDNGWRLETGYEGRIDWPDQEAVYYRTVYDTAYARYRYYDSLSSTHFKYDQQVHAVYATLGGRVSEHLSWQAGLRGEYASTYGEDRFHLDSDPIDKTYWQLYPTLHLSYKINDLQSLQVSYSRRVRRPRMWDLNPYMEVREGEQLGFGNPNLDPEYTNAFELSYNLGVKRVNIYTSLYFRQTNNMMTRYGFVWDSLSAARYSWWEPYNSEYDGYWASTWQNLASGYNYGLELIFDWQINKWWKLNVSVNLYQNRIEGTALLDDRDKESFQASGKFTSFMNLPHDWIIQLSGQYFAPWLDLQTDMDANYWLDLAVKKDVMQKRGTVSLRVSDILCTGGWGHTTHNNQMNRVVKAHRLSPMITLGFSYKINNGLRQRRDTDADVDEDSMESTSY